MSKCESDNAASGDVTFSCFFFQTASDAVTLEARQIVHKDFAVEMIDLMLDANCKQSLGLELKWLSVFVARLHANAFGPIYGCVDAGYRQTAFIDFLLAVEFQDFGINEYLEIRSIFRSVYDDDPARHVYLNCRQTNSRCAIHGFGHVTNERFDLVVEYLHLRGLVAKTGVGIDKNVELGHFKAKVSRFGPPVEAPDCMKNTLITAF